MIKLLLKRDRGWSYLDFIRLYRRKVEQRPTMYGVIFYIYFAA